MTTVFIVCDWVFINPSDQQHCSCYAIGFLCKVLSIHQIPFFKANIAFPYTHQKRLVAEIMSSEETHFFQSNRILENIRRPDQPHLTVKRKTCYLSVNNEIFDGHQRGLHRPDWDRCGLGADQAPPNAAPAQPEAGHEQQRCRRRRPKNPADLAVLRSGRRLSYAAFSQDPADQSQPFTAAAAEVEWSLFFWHLKYVSVFYKSFQLCRACQFRRAYID